jgi:hypothetical protein
VLEYKSAADVTLPRKRELEEADQEKPKPKKIKVSSRILKGTDARDGCCQAYLGGWLRIFFSLWAMFDVLHINREILKVAKSYLTKNLENLAIVALNYLL